MSRPSVVIALSVALLLMPGVPALLAEPVELVNPGFEDVEGETIGEPGHEWEQAGAPPGWSVWYGGTARASGAELVWTGAEARSGQRSVSVRSSDGPTVVMQQVPVEPSGVYTVRAWCRTSNPDSTVTVGSRWRKADGTWANSAQQRAALPGDVPAGEWYEIELVTQAPENADLLVIMLTGADQGPTGACWFDDVSVIRITDEDLYVGPVLSWMHQMFAPAEEPLQTEHIPWAKPRVGGPLSVLFLLGDDHNTREADELAQRLEMDFDVAFCRNYDGLLFALNDRQIRRKFSEREYDVVVVGTRVGRSLEAALQSYAADGGGIVLVGWPRMEPALEGVELTDAPEDHYVLEALDAFPVYPADPETSLLRSLQVGEFGEGRVLSIRWAIRSRCLTPQVTFAEHMQLPHNYHEAFLATLVRSVIWAAGDEPEAPLALRAGEASIAATGRFTGGVLEWRIWSQSGLSVLEREGDDTEIALPDVEAGPAFCALIIRDADGRVIDFACTLAADRTAERITSVTLDREWYAPGDIAQITAGVEGTGLDGLRVTATAFDAYGRELPGVEAPATGAEVELALPVPEAITTGHWLIVTLRDSTRSYDVACAPLLVPQPREDYFSEWRMSTWGSGNAMPPYLDLTFCEQLRACGIDSQLVLTVSMLSSVTGLQRPVDGGYQLRLPGTGPWDGEGTTRAPCLSDPEVRATIVQRAEEIAADHRAYGPICAYLRDETSLVKNDRDVCSCGHCAARYETWLRERYRSIEALNGLWGTNYADFSEPSFVAYRDARRQDTWAPWLEFRRFMDWTWTESVDLIRSGIRQSDPHVPVSYPNTFGPNPFAGRDYWQLAQVSDYSFEYMNAKRGDVDGSGYRFHYEPFAQWTAEGTPHMPWVGYVHEPEDIEFSPWWASLHGATGVTIYGSMSTFAGRASWAQLYPDLRRTKRAALYEEVTRDLREGVGRLLMAARRPQPKIALLWSQPSMYVGWMLSDFEGDPGGPARRADDPYGSHGWSRAAWIRLVHASGRHYGWLSPEQLPAALDDYDCLVLPATYALDERVVEAARSLLARGGTVIADMGVGVTNECGLPGARDEAVEELFGLRRDALPTWTKQEVMLPGQGAPIEVYGDEGTEPRIIRKGHEGGGTAYALTFVAPRVNEMLEWLEAEVFAPIEPVATLGHLPGEPGEYELVPLVIGELRLLGVLRERRLRLSNGPLIITLSDAAEVYDVRGRKYLGHTDAITADLRPGETAIYALLPYRVDGVTVTSGEVVAGDVCTLTATVNATVPTPEDHVLRIEVHDPAGNLSMAYTRSAVTDRGVAEVEIPFALNDAPGDWSVTARDVASGVAGSATVRLSARG